MGAAERVQEKGRKEVRRQVDGCKAEGQRMGWKDELKERQRVREKFQT